MTNTHLKVIKIVNTGRSLLYLIVGSLIVGTLVFWLLEPATLLDSFYWAGITMPTVGYGDVTPVTALGKVFAVAFAFWSLVVVANVIAYVHDKTHPDAHKLTHHEQEWLFESIERIAAAQNVTLDPQPQDNEAPMGIDTP